MGILFVNDGVIKELRFYEIDDSGTKSYLSGAAMVTAHTSKWYSCGSIAVYGDTLYADILVDIGKIHRIQMWKLPQLYCGECIKKIKTLERKLNVAFIDFTGYVVYDISKENHFWIRNYEIKIKRNGEKINIKVQYYQDQEEK